jgi:hypothetical protein
MQTQVSSSLPLTLLALDSSGNVGIGTTSPATLFEIKDTTTNTALTVTSSFEASLQLVNGGGSEVSVINAGGSNILSLRTGNSEKARIDSSGNVGIGTSSPVAKLGIVGGTSNASSLATAYSLATFNITPKSTSGYSLQFGSGPSDVPYIQMSAGGSAAGNLTIQPYGGNLLVGTTSQLSGSERLAIVNSSNAMINVRNSGATAGLFWNIQTDGSNTFYIYNASNTGVYLSNGATSWSGSSDERLKNITGTIQSGLTKLLSLRAVEFTWKADEESKPQVGLIAQDVQAVLPEVVDTSPEGYLGVRYSETVPLLVAAIQEQQALITGQQAMLASMTARIEALEQA